MDPVCQLFLDKKFLFIFDVYGWYVALFEFEIIVTFIGEISKQVLPTLWLGHFPDSKKARFFLCFFDMENQIQLLLELF
jgi:hypothetical protein